MFLRFQFCILFLLTMMSGLCWSTSILNGDQKELAKKLIENGQKFEAYREKPIADPLLLNESTRRSWLPLEEKPFTSKEGDKKIFLIANGFDYSTN